MTEHTASRINNALLAISVAMLTFATLCLCEAGEMVEFFLVAAAFALIPLGFDSRRAVKLIGLGIIAIAMAAAAADHQGGMKQMRRIEQRKATFALRAATTHQ